MPEREPIDHSHSREFYPAALHLVGCAVREDYEGIQRVIAGPVCLPCVTLLTALIAWNVSRHQSATDGLSPQQSQKLTLAILKAMGVAHEAGRKEIQVDPRDLESL